MLNSMKPVHARMAGGLILLLSVAAAWVTSRSQRPLAIVIIGGLISATLLTLIVLPVLYIVFAGRDEDAAAPGPVSESVS